MNRLARLAVVGLLAISLAAGTSVAPATATPAGQKAALLQLKKNWVKLPASTRKGTCTEYGKWPNSTLVHATNAAWGVPRNRRNMTIAEWLKVYKVFYNWAC